MQKALRNPLIETEKSYDIFQNKNGQLCICIKNCEGEVTMPEIFFSCGKNALFRRRLDQYVLLEDINEQAKNLLEETALMDGEAAVADVERSVTDHPEDLENIETYKVPVKLLPENVSLDSIEDIRDGSYLFLLPLILVLFPNDYNSEAHTFEPIKENSYNRAKVLIEECADVNVSLGSFSPFGNVLIYGSGEQRNKMLEYLFKKGADIDAALKLIEDSDLDSSPESCFALYEFYFYMYGADPKVNVNLKEFIERKDPTKATKYFDLALKAGYEPALKIIKNEEEWGDTKGIVRALCKAHPREVPVSLSRDQLKKMIRKFGLTESPEPPANIYLTSIIHEWILYFHGISNEELRRQRNSLPPEDR